MQLDTRAESKPIEFIYRTLPYEVDGQNLELRGYVDTRIKARIQRNANQAGIELKTNPDEAASIGKIETLVKSKKCFDAFVLASDQFQNKRSDAYARQMALAATCIEEKDRPNSDPT